MGIQKRLKKGIQKRIQKGIQKGIHEGIQKGIQKGIQGITVEGMLLIGTSYYFEIQIPTCLI